MKMTPNLRWRERLGRHRFSKKHQLVVAFSWGVTQLLAVKHHYVASSKKTDLEYNSLGHIRY